MEVPLLAVLFGFLCLTGSLLAFDLTIVHTNDVHSRFEEANAVGGKCKNESKVAGLCYGGVARRLTKIRELNSTNPNMILLDAGDQYQGTQWYSVYQGVATVHFMNKLGYQAMALGNHEFDRHIKGLMPLLKNSTFPVLSSNIDSSMEPSIRDLILPSTVLTVGGQRIGIIGYTTTDTPILSNSGDLIFKNEVEAIQPIIDEMKGKGINKIIALGHSGYARDQELARQLTDVDIIVGGHSHTFLYKGAPPSKDEVIGPYPTVVEKPNGDKVLVVQDFFFGKFLGFLKVRFSNDGKLESWEGNPILLNASVPEDPDLLAEIEGYKQAVENIGNQPVGESSVYLEGRRTICRLGECNLGNLITDSMIWNMAQLSAPNGTWITAAISLMNSGGIRSPIEPGEITVGDINTVLPFENSIDVIRVTGRVLLKALEHSVTAYNPDQPGGEFLQVAGLQVVYDLKRPVGNRVINIRARCQRCVMPKYEPVNPEDNYSIVLPGFLVDGGDGFDFELKEGDRISAGFLDADLFTQYVKHQSPVYSSHEGRILICSQDDADDIFCRKKMTGLASRLGSSSVTVWLSLMIATVIVTSLLND